VLNYLKSDLKIGAVGIKMIMAIELSSSSRNLIMVLCLKWKITGPRELNLKNSN
jgi:hypothetical protein